ncbi:MAG TPA: phosphatidate cytidylyltransferase [Terriglobales bacterium]|jgi:phosphatidate cytidylyltransferase|nr:phosphatidate cytidylyltransferase [Terriglobales bacterium]
MKRVATAVVLIPIVLLVVFRSPLWLFAAVVGFVALVTTREYLGIVEHYGIKPARALTYVFTLVLYAAWVAILVIEARLNSLPAQSLRAAAWFEHPYLALGLGVSHAAEESLTLAALLFLSVLLGRGDLRSALPAAAVSAFALAYVVVPLSLLIAVRTRHAGAFFVFYVLVVVWVGDILAFLVGRSWGNRKLAPLISPHKTWEGAVGSFIGATALGTLILHHASGIVDCLENYGVLVAVRGNLLSTVLNPGSKTLWVSVLVSAAVNLAAQLGDLAESLLKRGAGVKDSGSLLPGHGGMLDRIDALLFAAPVLWYYAEVLTAVRIP